MYYYVSRGYILIQFINTFPKVPAKLSSFYKVTARQNERRLEETKAEAGQLRNRLTLVEKNLNDSDSETKLHRKYFHSKIYLYTFSKKSNNSN